LAVSPLGEVRGQLGPEPGLLVVELDPAEVDTARAAVPVLANRKY
jgi:predicted amidohydrolase